ncbi:PQQ-binding-like beta-propeller repeat protein [Catenulispora yoronensis]
MAGHRLRLGHRRHPDRAGGRHRLHQRYEPRRRRAGVRDRHGHRQGPVDAAAGRPAVVAAGAAGVLGDQIIITANINVQGDGVFAVDKNKHTLLWKANTPKIGSVHVPPKGNLIFVGAKTAGNDNTNTITALDVTAGGKESWHYDQKYGVFGSAGEDFFAATDKFVFIGGQKLTALNIANGTLAWEAKIGDPDGSPSLVNIPILDGKGRVLVTADEYLAAVDATTGKILWQAKGPNQFQIDSPFAAADGNVYCVDYKGTLYAVDASSGAPKWLYANALLASQSPTTITAGNGKVFYTAGQAVMAFNATGK